ncbi:glycosyltransferase [Pseudomonas plecoglossicida]|uniref:glycosyltransferase n=1 Tax=Pseudomonas plecoglossicida TaxID=70775 RepID=UPI0005A34F2D|nr:glycosyltransferase [Pseudomonas plecoglossicida]AJG15108.1 glycosyltransferase [Pseudomonas plecoglossicida]
MRTYSKIMQPKVAIVTPIYKHSVLLTEAIESALTQRSNFPIIIVLVNDGCPHQETDTICSEYATAYPESIVYLKKLNGGLSSARNHGIKYALNTWPSIQAVYLLDADNRLRRDSVARGTALLESSSDCDWVYPNIDMFGVNWSGDYSGDYSLLIHTTMNICEAGSLIHRRVFDAGVYFDEDMRLGFEDWDFFLSAAAAGFKGKNLEDFGLRYRKRPESMLADSHRDQDEIKGGMLRKHKKLVSPKMLVSLEQLETPRYACYFSDTNEYKLTVDPSAPGKILTTEDYSRQLWKTITAKSREHSPAYLVIASNQAFERLSSSKLLHWSLWKLEQLLEHCNIGTLTICENDELRLRTNVTENSRGNHLEASIVMLSPACYREILLDGGTQWINTITSDNSLPRITNLELDLPKDSTREHQSIPKTATYHLLTQIHTLRSSIYSSAVMQPWEWREEGIPERARAHVATRQQFNGHPTYPKITSNSKHVGFILPLVEFGGVEKVTLNIARSMLRRGWTPHLFIMETNNISLPPEWLDTFDTVNFLDDDSQHHWDGAVSYLGTDISPWARHGNHGKAASLMYWLDAIVNCHGTGLHGMMGRLKRYGITTVASLHLSDMSPGGRPVGHTYLGLAFEHAYDFIAPCSNKLGDWCHAMGVPSEKIFPIQNAPSFPMTQQDARTHALRKTDSDHNRPLRVMFLGRLDKQKGLKHLAHVINHTKSRAMPVEWRIIGKSVITPGDSSLGYIDSIVEPPVFDEPSLIDLYDWADVLLLLSDYEGLPLTILEAMRQGVVVVATDVGAVSEVLNNETGYLIDPSDRTAQTLTAISELIDNREILKSKGNTAAEYIEKQSWDISASALITQLDEKYLARNTTSLA